MKFKLWQEDVTQPPNSGRRFRAIFRLAAPQRVPFVSLDFRNVDLDTWLALITRDGYLMVMEPVSADNLTDWQALDQFRVCPAPERGEETSFRVQFHHDPVDVTHSLMPDWDRKSLSLVVAAMDTVKVYRTDASRRFYHAIELSGHGGLVRDISWANGSVRGFDVIASGCKDGFVRIFEVDTSLSGNGPNQQGSRHAQTSSQSPSSRAVAQSGIGSALASRAPTSGTRRQAGGDTKFKHSFREVACLDSGHLDVWEVEFSPAGKLLRRKLDSIRLLMGISGDCLISSGDDGIVRFWKKSISGEWLEFAQTDMTDEYVP
jgi:nucleoporin SEH1